MVWIVSANGGPNAAVDCCVYCSGFPSYLLLLVPLQINSERYSRFTLQRAEDGERHIEVKLSDESSGDAAEVEGQAEGSPTFRPAPPHQTRLRLCYLATGLLLIFVTGRLCSLLQRTTTVRI